MYIGYAYLFIFREYIFAFFSCISCDFSEFTVVPSMFLSGAYSLLSLEPKAISKSSEEFVKTINPIYIGLFQNTVAQAIPIVFTKIINSFISNSRFRSGARRDVVATIARRHWRTCLLVRVLCFGAGVSHNAWRQFSPLAESTAACMKLERSRELGYCYNEFLGILRRGRKGKGTFIHFNFNFNSNSMYLIKTDKSGLFLIQLHPHPKDP